MKHLPNILTVSRFFMAVVFVAGLYADSLSGTVLAGSFFVAASLTDWLDGYLARKYDLISNFGKIMDPIADKFIVLAAFFVFADLRLFSFWMFWIIAIREVGVTLLRLKAVLKQQYLAAERAGKIKTVSQMGVIVLILAYLMASQFSGAGNTFPGQFAFWFQVIQWAMVWVVAITLFSGFAFLRNNPQLIYGK